MPVFNFCPRCGERLPEPDRPPDRLLSQSCPACGAVHYQNAKPCAGVLAIREGRVLLGRRAVEPFRGWWDIPGGFLEPWEHPSEAAVREVAEETGLRVRATELLGIFVDTYGEGGDYTLNVFYLGEVIGGEESPADDLMELGWFQAGNLPEQVAFRNGREALAAWEGRIKDQGRA